MGHERVLQDTARSKRREYRGSRCCRTTNVLAVEFIVRETCCRIDDSVSRRVSRRGGAPSSDSPRDPLYSYDKVKDLRRFRHRSYGFRPSEAHCQFLHGYRLYDLSA